MIALLLSVAGLLALLVGLALYVVRLRRGDLSRGPVEVAAGAKLSLAASGGAIVALLAGETSSAAIALTALELTLLGLLRVLHAQRLVPQGGLQVRVGDPLIPFTALTPEGVGFDTHELRGQRVLLKFFRGEWCPFCQAELRAFDQMADELAQDGVRVVALSKDTPEAARRHRERDGLDFTLLCDPELRVIRRYGVEHRKALEAAGPRITLFGFSMGTRPRFRAMAAPTTLLIDEHGVVRWVDQTDDYKVRSSRARVLGAVHAAFGSGGPRRVVPETERPSTARDEPSCAPC